MNKKSLQILLTLSLASASSFAAKEQVVRFQNQVRVGYDDNIYKTKDAQESAFITDIINLSSKVNFSSRTDLLLYWQPEFTYRFDAEPKFVTYQDLYGKFNHAISERVFLSISDRFRYQQKDGQTGAALSDGNQNFIENDLLGALNIEAGKKSDVKLGAGYEFRTWDDDNYGQTLGNDYQQLKADASYLREISPEKSTGMIGVNYVNHEYEGSRGGYDAVAALIGVDQTFSQYVDGFLRVGASFNSVDNGGGSSSDTTTPYLQAGLEYNPTERTSLTSSLGYSMWRSENSAYNAQDRFNFGIGAKHDVTAKISLMSSLSYIYSMYDGSYSIGQLLPDAEDNYFSFMLRGAYEINRNNFVELGYTFQTRSTDSALLTEWDGNRVDLAWRLRL